MKSLIFCTLSILYINIANAQNLITAWVQTWGNEDSHNGPAIAIDGDANIYATETFKGKMDFDPGPDSVIYNSPGFETHSYLSKFDSLGNFLWAKDFASTFLFAINDIVYEAEGFIYLTGNFTWDADFDPGPDSLLISSLGNSTDIFIVKLDLDGSLIWAKIIASEDFDFSNSIALDNEGNILITGYFSDTLDFDPGPNETLKTPIGEEDIYVAKYSTDGNLIWVQTFGGDGRGRGHAITVDTSGNIYTTGILHGWIDFDPVPGPVVLAQGSSDIFLSRLNSEGVFQWVKRLGGVESDWAAEIAVDENDGVYVTGDFEGTIDFNPSLNEHWLTGEKDDIFIWKLDTTGNFEWAVTFGGSTTNDFGSHITIDKNNGNVITTGYYMEEIDFDPGGTTFYLSPTGDINKNDIFILTLNHSGQFVSAYTLGGGGNDFGNQTLVDENGNYIISASFAETAGFSPGQIHSDSITSVGGTDAVLVKWKLCNTTYADVIPKTCGPYTSPSGNYTWNESGIYSDTIQNAGGCDSILTIYFTFLNIEMSIIQQGNVLIAQGNPEIAYWLDCNNGYNVVGSGYVLLPLVNGNYAVVGESFQCIDTSECFAFVMTSATDINPEAQFTIYPNPVKNSFFLNLHQSYKDIEATIIDQLGHRIYSQVSSSSQVIPFSVDLPSGIYFMKVIADGTSAVLRIMIE